MNRFRNCGLLRIILHLMRCVRGAAVERVWPRNSISLKTREIITLCSKRPLGSSAAIVLRFRIDRILLPCGHRPSCPSQVSVMRSGTHRRRHQAVAIIPDCCSRVSATNRCWSSAAHSKAALLPALNGCVTSLRSRIWFWLPTTCFTQLHVIRAKSPVRTTHLLFGPDMLTTADWR
jgi:hypothetical protein